MGSISAFLLAFLYKAVCITGAATLAYGCFKLEDAITRPPKKKR